MFLSWLNHVPVAQKEEVKSKVLANKEAWALLVEVLDKRIQTLPPNYEEHGWAYKVADQNGYNKALREVIDLLKSV